MKNFALIVGMNEYPARAGQTILEGAVADACDFADWALDPAGGDVDAADLHFWTHPAPSATAGRLKEYLKSPAAWEGMVGPIQPDNSRGPTAQEIVATAYKRGRELQLAALEGVAQQSRIYVFLAGHGIRAQEVDGGPTQTCFLAADFNSLNGLTVFGLIPTMSFRDGLLIGGFDEVVMFLDCCRVQDPITRMKAVTVCGAKAPTPPAANWTYANATLDGGVALEIDVPPIRGAFSHILLTGLRGERDNQHNLRAEQLKGFVRERIATRSRGQNPDLTYNPNDGVGMVIATGVVAPPPPGPPPDLVLNFANVAPGTPYRLVDDRIQTVPGYGQFASNGGIVTIPGLQGKLYGVARLDGAVPMQMFSHSSEPIDVE